MNKYAKLTSWIVVLLLALAAIPSAEAAFVIGGENGWQFSTDGFVNVFGVYQVREKVPAGPRTGGEIGGPGFSTGNETQQQFSVRTGLLPTCFGFNIKAPTTDGVDYAVRLGIYPQIQNAATGGSSNTRTDINPNVDFREVNFTAEGSFGQVLAGRALNLFMGKNILTDMTLFSAGTVGPVNNGPTMGHIGYGYLYPNFGAQIRYTTPSMGGVKVAVSVNDPYNISTASNRNIPRFESEVSYASKFNDMTMQGWIGGLYQTARFSDTAGGGSITQYGGTFGASVGVKGLDLLLSGYGGQALGGLGVDGDVDSKNHPRQDWGFLAQATYKLTPTLKIGANYGQTNTIETAQDTIDRIAGTNSNIKTKQCAVGTLTYNVNKFTQLIAEYSWAQDKWHDGNTQDSNTIALGTFFYW